MHIGTRPLHSECPCLDRGALGSSFVVRVARRTAGWSLVGPAAHLGSQATAPFLSRGGLDHRPWRKTNATCSASHIGGGPPPPQMMLSEVLQALEARQTLGSGPTEKALQSTDAAGSPVWVRGGTCAFAQDRCCDRGWRCPSLPAAAASGEAGYPGRRRPRGGPAPDRRDRHAHRATLPPLSTRLTRTLPLLPPVLIPPPSFALYHPGASSAPSEGPSFPPLAYPPLSALVTPWCPLHPPPARRRRQGRRSSPPRWPPPCARRGPAGCWRARPPARRCRRPRRRRGSLPLPPRACVAAAAPRRRRGGAPFPPAAPPAAPPRPAAPAAAPAAVAAAARRAPTRRRCRRGRCLGRPPGGQRRAARGWWRRRRRRGGRRRHRRRRQPTPRHRLPRRAGQRP